jgi:hypothetical protein
VGRRLVVLLPVVAVGCRGVLGIDPLPPIADAGSAEDAAPDVLTGPTYCDTVSPPPQLCSDFDKGAAVGAGWENATQNPDPGEQGGGKLSLDQGLFKLPPAGLPASAQVTTPALAATGDRAAAILLLRLTRPVRFISLSFDVFVTSEDYAAGGFVTLASIDFGSGGVLIVRDGLGTSFSTGPDSATFRLSKSIPVGAWKNVALLIDNEPSDGGPDGFVHISVDELTAGHASFPASMQSAGPPNVLVGASASGPTGPFKANVDNVILRFIER